MESSIALLMCRAYRWNRSTAALQAVAKNAATTPATRPIRRPVRRFRKPFGIDAGRARLQPSIRPPATQTRLLPVADTEELSRPMGRPTIAAAAIACFHAVPFSSMASAENSRTEALPSISSFISRRSWGDPQLGQKFPASSECSHSDGKAIPFLFEANPHQPQNQFHAGEICADASPLGQDS